MLCDPQVFLTTNILTSHSKKQTKHYSLLIHLLFQAVSHINTDNTDYSVDDSFFVPDSEYSARVRSSPNQAFYKGEWSDWSSEVQWKTEPAINSEASLKQLLSKF